MPTFWIICCCKKRTKFLSFHGFFFFFFFLDFLLSFVYCFGTRYSDLCVYGVAEKKWKLEWIWTFDWEYDIWVFGFVFFYFYFFKWVCVFINTFDEKKTLQMVHRTVFLKFKLYTWLFLKWSLFLTWQHLIICKERHLLLYIVLD